jgi:DNA-directed RNA polymerase specialized sigma54-like protein
MLLRKDEQEILQSAMLTLKRLMNSLAGRQKKLLRICAVILGDGRKITQRAMNCNQKERGC